MSHNTLKRKERRLRSKFLEISKDINCIPAGVYRLREEKDGVYEFSVGPNIRFMVMNIDSSTFRELPCKEGRKRTIAVHQFLDRYYELLETTKREPWRRILDRNRPFTMCLLTTSVSRDMQ